VPGLPRRVPERRRRRAAAAGAVRGGPRRRRRGDRPGPGGLLCRSGSGAAGAERGRSGHRLRPTIPDLPADYYVSYDNEAIGAAIAQSLVDHLTETGAQGGILQINGSPTDAAAGLIRDGVDSVVDDGPFEELAEFDTPDWLPPEAQEFTEGAISQYDDQIVGVVAANDGTGGAAIAALQGAGREPVPPVTGNDAEIAAVQRIIAGTQFNTISKPSVVVGEAAAEAANAFLEGEPPEGDTTLFDTPAELFEPTVVTRDNVKEVIFDGEIYTVEEVCTGEFAAGCAELGIQ